jgi:hypothetical protein
MLIHSPSTPTTTSVRFLFLIPLMLHTPFAWMRPLLEPTDFDSEAKVKGAPISLSTDIAFARLVVSCARSARVAVAAPVALALFDMETKKLPTALAVARVAQAVAHADHFSLSASRASSCRVAVGTCASRLHSPALTLQTLHIPAFLHSLSFCLDCLQEAMLR